MCHGPDAASRAILSPPPSATNAEARLLYGGGVDDKSDYSKINLSSPSIGRELAGTVVSWALVERKRMTFTALQKYRGSGEIHQIREEDRDTAIQPT